MHRHLPYKRVDRVNDLIRRIVSQALMMKIHHQGLEGVTVTEVDVTPDLRHGKVYYRVMDLGKRVDIKKSLERIKPLIQKELSGQMQTRNTPVLEFVYDESFDYGQRIDHLLDSIKKPDSQEE